MSVEQAVDAAVNAFPGWRRAPPAERAALLRAMADEADRRGAAIIAAVRAETGLDDARLSAELARCQRTCRWFAAIAEADAWREVLVDPSTPDLRRWLIPVGPVAVFGASNVPLMGGTLGTDTVAALAAGCPVVVRGHPAQPETSERLAETVAAAGLPAGVFGLVQGEGHDIGLALVRAPGIRAVAFTGSHAGGRALFDAAASRPDPVPVYAEMGSVNPVVVLPSAVTDPALVDGLANAVTRAGGQLCTKPGLVLVPDVPEADRLVTAVAERIDATQPVPALHAGVREGYLRRLAEVGVIPGVTVVAEGDSGTVLQARIATVLDDPVLRCEIFGPAVLFVRYTGEADLMAFARALTGELTASLHGAPGELTQARELIDELATKAGRILWNAYPTGTPESVAMHHGGPYPAATDPRYTSIGPAAIRKFARPVAYQNFPRELLPTPLRNDAE